MISMIFLQMIEFEKHRFEKEIYFYDLKDEAKGL